MRDCTDTRSFWQRFRNRWLYRRLRRQNRPMFFDYVESGGEEVGYPFPVCYPALYDMAEHMIGGELTRRRLVLGLDCNAFRVLFKCHVDKDNMMAIVQALRVAEADAKLAA